jgi:hypothetical protein
VSIHGVASAFAITTTTSGNADDHDATSNDDDDGDGDASEFFRPCSARSSASRASSPLPEQRWPLELPLP